MLEEDEEDWTVLPPELIQIIAKKLPDLLDFIHFRATCKTWCSSTSLSDSPAQFPWLIELLEGRCGPTSVMLSKTQQFYSVSSLQTLTIHLTLNQSEKLWVWINKGVFSHYLSFTNFREETMSFFNPLSKDQFLLPSPRLGCLDPWMIWTSTDPIRNRNIVVVDRSLDLPNEIGGWACYDLHTNKWVEQEGYYYNSCYWQGMFFSTEAARETEVFDASSKKLLHKIPPPENELIANDSWFQNSKLTWLLRRSYHVESLEIILRVSWFHEHRNTKIVEDSIFQIYKLEFDGLDGQPCWVRIHNIGNQILFLENMIGFSMTARPSIGFKEGCIYFIDPYYNKPYVYDILAGTVGRVPCPFEKCTWFIPSLC